MRQRVVIAMAVALRPPLLIMDEPTTALDVVVQQEIMAQIGDLQRELGFSVLFITHDMSLMIELSHRMAVMYAGRFVETAEAKEHVRRPAAPLHPGADQRVPAAARTRVTRCRAWPKACGSPTSPTCARRRPATGSHPYRSAPPTSIGETVHEHAEPLIEQPGDTLQHRTPSISLRGLTKDFQVGGLFSRRTVVRALNAVDLDVERGEIMALVGESGSGKSTIARCVARLEQPTSGQILRRRRRRPPRASHDGRRRRTAARCRWSSRTRSAR